MPATSVSRSATATRRVRGEAPCSVGEERRNRGFDRGQVGLEAVVAADDDDRTVRAGRRQAERVALTLHDEGPHGDGVELVQAALLGLSGRVQRESEAEDAARTDDSRSAAGDARAGGAA